MARGSGRTAADEGMLKPCRWPVCAHVEPRLLRRAWVQLPKAGNPRVGKYRLVLHRYAMFRVASSLPATQRVFQREETVMAKSRVNAVLVQEEADEQPLVTRIVTCHLKSVSPYSQSKHIVAEPNPGENPVAFEERCWRERLHVNGDGHVYIPPTSFTASICEAAKFLSMPIPGKARYTFTKNFEAGVRVLEGLVIPNGVDEDGNIKWLTPDDVHPEALFLNSDGKRGSGKRVTRYYPRIEKWEGEIKYWIFDPVITEAAFYKALQASGTLIGIGRFRPRNLGFYGRFEVLDVQWREGL